MIVQAVTQKKIPYSWHYAMHCVTLVIFILGYPEERMYLLGFAAMIYLYTNIDLRKKKSISDLICITFILFVIGCLLESLFYKILNLTDWRAHSSSLGAEVIAKIFKFTPLNLELLFLKVPDDSTQF